MKQGVALKRSCGLSQPTPGNDRESVWTPASVQTHFKTFIHKWGKAANRYLDFQLLWTVYWLMSFNRQPITLKILPSQFNTTSQCLMNVLLLHNRHCLGFIESFIFSGFYWLAVCASIHFLPFWNLSKSVFHSSYKFWASNGYIANLEKFRKKIDTYFFYCMWF